MDCRYFSILTDHDFFDVKVFQKISEKNSIVYLAVDPGKKNLALRIEERQVREDSWEVVFFEKITLLGSQNNFINSLQKLLCCDILHNKKLDIVLIESQSMINHINVAIHAHIRSFFLTFAFFNNKELLVIDLSPSLKGHALGFDKNKLKVQSFNRACTRFEEKDQMSRDKLFFYAKGDDLADTFNMIEAFHKVYITKEIALGKMFQKKKFQQVKNKSKKSKTKTPDKREIVLVDEK